MLKKFTRSQKLKRNTVINITLFWAIVALVFAVHNHLFLVATHDLGVQHYDFWINLLATLLIVPLAGFLAGGTIVYILKVHLSKFPLWAVLIIDTLIIVVLVIFISIPASLIYNSIYFQKPPWDGLVMIHSLDFMFGFGMLHTLFFWTLVALITMLVLQVNEKYGQGIFLKMIKGDYHRPKVETRIFMFLDIRSSTAMAEQLGHVKWFELLNNFFNDITEPILDTHGEIYQYVGDEIIIHWDTRNGLKDNNCLHCFFEISERIKELDKKYQADYGVTPRFKAAIHCGNVTVGEIGKIKKDIVFTGDVLNTTARIQELCNEYKVDMLVSQEVMELLTDTKEFLIKPVGYIELRGKQTPVSIFTISRGVIANEVITTKVNQAEPS